MIRKLPDPEPIAEGAPRLHLAAPDHEAIIDLLAAALVAAVEREAGEAVA